MRTKIHTFGRLVMVLAMLVLGGCEDLDFAIPTLKPIDGEDGGGAGREKRYALIIGIDRYQPGYASPLGSCVNDANGLYQKFTADRVRWNASRMTLWTDAQARLATVRNKMAELARTATAGDLVVYYQSSHGGRHAGTRAFLCTYNANYEDTAFAQDLARFKDGVNIIVIIDACNAAGMYKADGVPDEWDFPDRVMRELALIVKSRKGPNVGWLASSDYHESSFAGRPYSQFTGHLLNGFRYGDANRDGVVTFMELFNYAEPRTRWAHRPQASNSALLSAIVAARVN